MAKTGDLKPNDRREPTPAPEVVVEDLVSDADPTLEWTIADLGTLEAAQVTPPPDRRVAAPQDGAGPASEQVPWSVATSDATPPPVTAADAARRNTPPPIPLEAAIGPDVGDEDVLIVDPPEPPRTAAPAPAPAPKPAGPPPVPPAAAQGSAAPGGAPPPFPPILLPDLPAAAATAGTVAPGAWPEALSQRPRRKRLKPWFEEVFDEDYLRTLPFMTAEQTLREVSFIREALQPPADGHLLDVACGYGRHAIELSQRGLRVTGLDLSLPLLIRAADESQRRGLSVNFVHADMREMTFDGQFDGAYCVLTSFGYFDEETNLKVASSICRALKPGGRLLLDTVNRDYIVGDLPTRVWWEGDGCVVLEEVDFNFHTSRVMIRRSVVFQDGRQVEQDISIRAYSLHELGKLMRQAGFRVLDVSGSLATKGNFFGSTSRNIIMVCERPVG